MAEQHSPKERVALFRQGWCRGASRKAIPETPIMLKFDKDFQEGHKEGCAAFTKAILAVRKRYGAPLPGILRVQKEKL